MLSLSIYHVVGTLYSEIIYKRDYPEIELHSKCNALGGIF